MTYHFTTTVTMPFDKAIEVVTEALKAKGFGVLTTIDVKAALKSKIDVDFRPYTILGACNPRYAHRALQHEDKIGTMLPCNVVLQEKEPGKIEVSAIDPIASMQAIDNPKLGDVATEVRAMLKDVIDGL
ncbi:MAG: DUF302 domain-containing protein [Alphaproteobacteria bacterium]